MNILIADDDIVSQTILSEQLQALGHEVSVASDGEEAWRLYKAARFQILITDWMMPKVDGLELSRMIRAENREAYTYIIFLTVLDGKGSFLETMKAGADDLITKPFDSEQLAARLRVGERILGMQHELHQLQGLLPICSHCRKIRDEDKTWQPIESYIMSKTDTSFSHSICPECYEKHTRPEMEKLRRKKESEKKLLKSRSQQESS